MSTNYSARTSQYFLPIKKDISSDVVLKSHQLMLKSGVIRQVSAGLYAWLPLGMRVLHKVSNIIRDELSRIHCHEVMLPTMQPQELWDQSGRGSYCGKETLKAQDRHGNTLVYGPTAEEVMTFIIQSDIKSYKNLPILLHNIQWKFRDEIRPRFGVMRAREFLMMDAYSFDETEVKAEETYNKIYGAYLQIFAQMGLTAIPMKADTGEIGGDLSHEFIILAQSGESEVFYEKKIDTIITKIQSGEVVPNLQREISKCYARTEETHIECEAPKDLVKTRGIEVGHIFHFGQKYSIPFNVQFQTKEGKLEYPYMGSYGIGVGRLIAAFIEANHDENGIIWHNKIAPFSVILINVNPKNESVATKCDEIYHKMSKKYEVLYDDEDLSFGKKLARAELLGIPTIIIVSQKTLEQDSAEVRNRSMTNGSISLVKTNDL
ncbi:MAG: prolyl-tRNA synthetase [Candidatus Deianiraeaceae bacterium]|jgi:prolyl-tRNA synthetase